MNIIEQDTTRWDRREVSRVRRRSFVIESRHSLRLFASRRRLRLNRDIRVAAAAPMLRIGLARGWQPASRLVDITRDRGSLATAIR